jgi:fructokinase
MMLRPDELDLEHIERAVFFHFGSVSLSEEPCRSATLQAARAARAAGVMVSFDVNYRPTLWRREEDARAVIRAAIPLADVVKVNEKEIDLLSGGAGIREASRRILEWGPAVCALTVGPQGSAFASRAAEGRAPGFPVAAVDATGCGDAFMGALLVRLSASLGGKAGPRRPRLERLSGSELEGAFRYANAAGALTATRKGVIPALPTAVEVKAFLEG